MYFKNYSTGILVDLVVNKPDQIRDHVVLVINKKSDFSSERYCNTVKWTSPFFQGTRNTRPCLTGHPVNECIQNSTASSGQKLVNNISFSSQGSEVLVVLGCRTIYFQWFGFVSFLYESGSSDPFKVNNGCGFGFDSGSVLKSRKYQPKK